MVQQKKDVLISQEDRIKVIKIYGLETVIIPSITGSDTNKISSSIWLIRYRQVIEYISF